MPTAPYNELVCYSSKRKPNKDGFLIRTKEGKQLTSNSLNSAYTRAQKRIDVPHIRFHDLRHTYATIMLKQGINIKIVSRILGHSNIGITADIYSHVDTSMQMPALTVITENIYKKSTQN